MSDEELHRAQRQLEALTLAARDFAGRAAGARERAADIVRAAAQVRRWAQSPPGESAFEQLAALPDPPTARALAHRLRASGDWSIVTQAADAAAEEASQEAAERSREHERTEALRQEAVATIARLRGGSGTEQSA